MATYQESLSLLPGISMNPEPQNTVNGAWMPTVVFAPDTGITREKLHASCAADNIDARVFFWPLSGLPMFEPKVLNVHAWTIPNRSINLPSYHDMSETDLSRVIRAIDLCVHG